MIFSGRKRSATCRAKRRMTRMGTFAPRYQRVGGAFGSVRRLGLMPSFYHEERGPDKEALPDKGTRSMPRAERWASAVTPRSSHALRTSGRATRPSRAPVLRPSPMTAPIAGASALPRRIAPYQPTQYAKR